MHGPTCIFWANLTPVSLSFGRADIGGSANGNGSASDYTTRELSNRCYEIPALRSLSSPDDHFFDAGAGGGASWLQEHLQGGYHRRWSTSLSDGESPDAAIADTSLTRWENYYIQGLQWLTQPQENQKYASIDGLYLVRSAGLTPLLISLLPPLLCSFRRFFAECDASYRTRAVAGRAVFRPRHNDAHAQGRGPAPLWLPLRPPLLQQVPLRRPVGAARVLGAHLHGTRAPRVLPSPAPAHFLGRTNA
jgi:hypothetical protein